MKTILITCLMVASVTALSAQSEDRERGPRPDPATIFKAADTNEDSFIDMAEFTAFRENMPRGPRGGNRGANAEGRNSGDTANSARPPRGEGQGRPEGRGPRNAPTAEEMFATMDKNEDGKIAQDEFTMGNRQGRGPGGRGQGGRAQKPE